jgi:hypothetical protein
VLLVTHSLKPSKSIQIVKEIKMSYENELRDALSQSKDAKDASRSAGEGIWANYVRATCYPYAPRDMEGLDATHKNVVETLNNIRELTKEEKNSLRSAKCVVGKAITNNMDVWKRTAEGAVENDDNGHPMPKGKSELNEAKSDFDRMMAFIEQASKKYDSDTREQFTREQMSTIADAYAALAHRMVEDYQAVQ